MKFINFYNRFTCSENHRSILPNLLQSLIALLLSALPLALDLSAASIAAPTANSSISLTSSTATATQSAIDVRKIARQTTVRILGKSSAGSGVILKQQQKTYTVLTCAHVVAGTTDNGYTILTADGLTYPVKRLRTTRLRGADLALIEFTSSHSYRVAELGNSDALAVGAVVYAAGFPNWQSTNHNAIENTQNWGSKAFSLTVGKIGMMLTKPLQEAYQMGYTNEVEDGMSGGPVLDHQGQLVGINGRLKYPFQGIKAFVFEDGTIPPELLFQQMEALSWAIPITNFQMLKQM